MKEISTEKQMIRKRYSMRATMTATTLLASTMLFFPWSQAQATGSAKDIELHGATGVLYDAMAENTSTNITVGPKATVMMGGGKQEGLLSFGETFSGRDIKNEVEILKNLPAGIAVGANTYARTGSIELGDHTLEKNDIAIGDSSASKLKQFGVASTTVGTNSYTGGGFATTLGSYNVQSSPFNANGFFDTLSNATKNAFATVVGSLNSNESMSSRSSTSGVANVITGTANSVKNSNGAITMGAGNRIENSIGDFSASAYNTKYASVKDMQTALQEGVAKSAGGATLAIGGANTADYTSHTQIIGVGNTVTGTKSMPSKYNMVNGYKNTLTNASHLSVIGAENTVTDTTSSILLGDHRTLTAANESVLIGGATKDMTTNVARSTAIGFDSNVTTAGGVAVGSQSVSNTAAGAAGYDPATKQASKLTDHTWVSTLGAVSVGNTDKQLTRQITGVAAGTNDTDAVNVAQLKAVAANSQDGNDTLVTSTTGLQLQDKTLSLTVTDTAGHSVTGTVDLSSIATNPAAFNRMESSINSLSGRVDSLGASAAALAALHPQDYNSEDKWDISAGYGNYHGSHALALGAFYRPNEKTMVSFSTNLGGSERLFNAGLSFKFGESNPYATYSKSQLVTLVQQQQEQIAQQQAGMQQVQEQLRRIMERLEIK